MTEYLNVRASETLGQVQLVRFLKSRFPQATKPVGRTIVQGTECVETRVRSGSSDFDIIKEFVNSKRKEGIKAFCDFTIGWYLRKYTRAELRSAEILRVTIPTHFQPAGEECGTVYETLCPQCNLGRQISELILDLRRVPQQKAISETISGVEWVVSPEFVDMFNKNRLTGADFQPIFDLKNPTKTSPNGVNC